MADAGDGESGGPVRIARCVWGDQGRLQATGSMIYGGDVSRSASAGAGTGYGTCAWEERAKQRCMEGGG